MRTSYWVDHRQRTVRTLLWVLASDWQGMKAEVTTACACHKGAGSLEACSPHLREGIVEIAPRTSAEVGRATLAEVVSHRAAHHVQRASIFLGHVVELVAGTTERVGQKGVDAQAQPTRRVAGDETGERL